MAPVHDPRFSGTRWEGVLESTREEARRAHRRAYIIPLLMLAAGWLAAIAYPVIVGGDGVVDAVVATGMWLVILAISVVAGVLGLVITCKLFGDDAGNLWLALVRLAGIYAVVMVVGAALSGLGCYGLIVTLAIMAGLVAMLFEMEFKEGLVVAIVTWLVWVGASLGITALMN